MTIKLTDCCAAAQAAADQATKEWLGSAKIGIPRMVRDGDTGQIALSHADVSNLPPLKIAKFSIKHF